LTGHAADGGDVTLAVAVDWAHAVAASAWTGGLIALALVAGRREAPWSRESLAAVVPRFSRLAGLCLLAVAVTGSYNAWTQLGGFSRLVTTAYGRVLIAKLVVVAVLVWLGAVNRYVLLPRLAPESAARGPGARAFRMVRLATFAPSRGATAGPGESRLMGYVTAGARLGASGVAFPPVIGATHAGPPRGVRAQDDQARAAARPRGRRRSAAGDRDAAARRRRPRPRGLREARVRRLSCGARPERCAADAARPGSGRHRRTPSGRDRRVDHEPERADSRWAGLHGRARSLDHAGLPRSADGG